MRLSAVSAILALTVASYACDEYKYCHCTNADKTPNGSATVAACGASGPFEFDQGITECKHFKNYFYVYEAINNCDFRKACNMAGAMGDSKCMAKVGLFKA